MEPNISGTKYIVTPVNFSHAVTQEETISRQTAHIDTWLENTRLPNHLPILKINKIVYLTVTSFIMTRNDRIV